MTEEQRTLLIIRGTIADLEPEMREKVEQHYRDLKALINDSPMAAVAIAWIGAEIIAS